MTRPALSIRVHYLTMPLRDFLRELVEGRVPFEVADSVMLHCGVGRRERVRRCLAAAGDKLRKRKSLKVAL